VEEAQPMSGDTAEANRLFAAQPLGHGLERRFAPDLGTEAVGDDDADVRRQDVQREVVADPEKEPVAMVAIVAPLGVGAKIGKPALDLDDDEAPLAVLAQHVRPPAGAERHFDEGANSHLVEQPADPAHQPLRPPLGHAGTREIQCKLGRPGLGDGNRHAHHGRY